ncbi:MAG: hypothetical protein LV477_11430 [Candidatus Nitrosotalea sp.]|nr:hypothetical protein [Candidatus Nitrosotalea sp.]
MKRKVGLIVGIQVTIIVSSFLILVYFENQSTFLGNSINISGKNRYLAESLYAKSTIFLMDGNPKPVIDVVTSVDENILALSSGRSIPASSIGFSNNDLGVMAVPDAFSNELKQVQDKWSAYKSVVENILETKKAPMQNPDLDNAKSQFITAADNLTYVLGTYGKEQVSNLILLQLLLLGINVVAHVFLLKLILNILRRDYVQKLLIKQVSNNNKQLSFESQISILQKDILESFLDDMKGDLQKLKNQVSVMDFPSESGNNKFVFHEIMHNLSTRIEQLAGSKRELDDNISHYQKLNLNLAKQLSAISNSKHNDVKKTDDVVAIIRSYIDSINRLIANQNIPPHLGNRLIDVMHDIADGLEELKAEK